MMRADLFTASSHPPFSLSLANLRRSATAYPNAGERALKELVLALGREAEQAGLTEEDVIEMVEESKKHIFEKMYRENSV